MKLVMKFGGGLLTSGAKIKDSARLVKDEVDSGNPTVVVVSAIKSVTDLLVDATEGLSAFSDPEAATAIRQSICKRLRDRHMEAIEDVGGGKSGGDTKARVSAMVEKVDAELVRFGQGDSSRMRRDGIIAMGEQMSAPIFAYALSRLGTPAASMTGGEAGIVTDSNFGSASPRMDLCQGRIPERVGALLDSGVVPIVTGFIAQDESGAVTTLGRGGSDYTASILGSCLGVEEIWIWKDVGGIMTANPQLVPDARTIPMLSYSEAAELAHFGAEVLHPKTMEPAMVRGIPIRVKGAAEPRKPGTLISPKSMDVESSVKAVTSEDQVGLLAISGSGMAGVPGVAAKVLDSLAREKANVMMISQSSSETNITIVVHKRDLPACRQRLMEDFGGGDLVKDISFDEEVCIISVVGSGMKGTPGVAAKLFKAVADVGVNVMMIAQGSSEVNISFVVSRREAERAVVSIHDEFRLGEGFPG